VVKNNSSETNEVVEVIKKIVLQNQLLWLNAAVEAARAGDKARYEYQKSVILPRMQMKKWS